MNNPAIKFVKVERDCQSNRNSREDAANGHQSAPIIYDYEVIDNGVKAAMFGLWISGRRGYALLDMDGNDIKREYNPSKNSYGGVIKVETKSEFEAVYLDAKSMGLVPTREQIDARIADEAKKEEEQRLAQLEQQRIRRIQDAGPQLQYFLKQIIQDLPQSRDWLDPDIERGASELLKSLEKVA